MHIVIKWISSFLRNCGAALVGEIKTKFNFIKWVDKGYITTVKDLESWRFER